MMAHIDTVGTPRAAPAADPHDPASGRAAALDVFRAVVCLQIVAMHTYFGAAHEWLASRLGDEGNWVVTHLRFGYESFFVIAGYFLARSFRPGRWSQFSVPRFFTRRVVRLAVPYWIAAALGVVGLLARGSAAGVASGVPDWPGVLPVFCFAHTLGPSWSPCTALWFMAVLIQLYVVWCLAFWVIRRWYLWAGWDDFHGRAVAALQVLTAAVFIVSLWGQVAGLSRAGTAERCAVFLALGCMTYWQSGNFAARVFLVAGVAALVAAGVWAESSRLVAAAVTGVILPVLTGRSAPDNLFARLLAAVGACSYSIYLTHMYVAPRVLHLPSAWGGMASFGEAAAVYLLAIVASLAFGFAFYWVVERPLARFSRQITYRVAAHGYREQSRPVPVGAATG